MSDTEKEVRQVLETVFSRPIGDDEAFSAETEPTWDSLRQVEVILAVEGALGIRFEEDEMATLDSLEKLVRSVRRHRAA